MSDEIQEKSDNLLDEAKAKIYVFEDQDGNPRAVIDKGEYKEVVHLSDKRLRNHLRDIYYQATDETVSAEVINRVVATLEMFADRADSPVHTVGTRVLETGGNIYYYIDNQTMVEISENKASLKKMSMKKVFFNKSYPQVKPDLDSPPEKLLELMGRLVRASQDQLLLLTVWLCSCFIPWIFHPILTLMGVPGCSKSTNLKAYSRIIDPAVSDLLTMTSDRRNLVSTLSSRYFIAFDNLRILSKWVSDLLCNAVTGGHESMRQLFTSNDNLTVSIKGCVGMNGVECVATERDL